MKKINTVKTYTFDELKKRFKLTPENIEAIEECWSECTFRVEKRTNTLFTLWKVGNFGYDEELFLIEA